MSRGCGKGLHSIIKSKRDGYIDFLGSVNFVFDVGTELKFSSEKRGGQSALPDQDKSDSFELTRSPEKFPEWAVQ